MKRSMLSVVIAGIVGLGLAMDAAWGARAALKRGATVFLVPARPRVVQLAFDIAALRSAEVMAWHGTAKTSAPVLYVWSGSAWRYVSLSDFSDKAFLSCKIDKVFVIGDHRIVPTVLLDNMPWCADVERLETIDVTALINGLDKTLHFSEGEWIWLADRYKLTLTDLNVAKRNYNPYDIPRSKLPLERREYRHEKGGLPPAELIENKTGKAVPAPAASPEP